MWGSYSPQITTTRLISYISLGFLIRSNKYMRIMVEEGVTIGVQYYLYALPVLLRKLPTGAPL